MLTAIHAPSLTLPKSRRIHVPHALRATWTVGRFTCEAAIWLLFVSILLVVCAVDGVNRFGDWSDQ
jgi:hypothetical protein